MRRLCPSCTRRCLRVLFKGSDKTCRIYKGPIELPTRGGVVSGATHAVLMFARLDHLDEDCRIMKCIVHIGTEKTGSTTLQSFLQLNASALHAQSMFFPTIAGTPNHYALAMATSDFDEPNIARIREDLAINSPANQRAFAARLGQEILDAMAKAGCDTLLLSSENFHHGMRSPASVAKLRSFLNSLGFETIQIIVYLRRPADLINSWYSTAVRWGETSHEPPDVLQSGCDSLAVDCRYDATLKRWENEFGRDSMCVRIFERQTLVGGSVIDDFASVTGISLDASMAIPGDTNVSLSHDSIEVMRRVNVLLGDSKDRSSLALRNVIADAVEQAFGTSSKYTMPSRLYDAYQAAYAASNERVRATYFPQRASLFEDSRTPPPSAPALTVADHDRIAQRIIAEVRAASRSQRAWRHLPNKLIKVLSELRNHDDHGVGTLSFVDRLLGRQSTVRKAA